MKVVVLNTEGQEVGTREVLGDWERRPVVPALLQQAVVTADANIRIARAHTKTRGEVRGGGRKPWRQKGTGRARAGSIRSPLWKGGGVTFGPRAERTYRKRLPAAMRRSALAQALVAKASAGELLLVESLPTTGKTKDLKRVLARLGRPGSLLLAVPPAAAALLVRAGRNLPRTRVSSVQNLTAADVLKSKHLVLTPDAWDVLDARLRPSRGEEKR